MKIRGRQKNFMVRTYSGSPDEKEQISRQHLSTSLDRVLRSSLDLAMAIKMKRIIRTHNSHQIYKSLSKAAGRKETKQLLVFDLYFELMSQDAHRQAASDYYLAGLLLLSYLVLTRMQIIT